MFINTKCQYAISNCIHGDVTMPPHRDLSYTPSDGTEWHSRDEQHTHARRHSRWHTLHTGQPAGKPTEPNIAGLASLTFWIWAFISGKRLINLTYVDNKRLLVGLEHRWNLLWRSSNWTMGLHQSNIETKQNLHDDNLQQYKWVQQSKQNYK